MSHWRPGRKVVPHPNSGSREKRFFAQHTSAWVIARHNDYIYIKVNWADKDDMIFRCREELMQKYFAEVQFHDEMPYVNGPFKNVKIFPDDLL